MNSDADFMRLALRLARRGYGMTSPNPLVGAVLVKGGKIIGQGWHRRAGKPHAEIEAMRDVERKGRRVAGATLYVTLEPCCTHGRTPPCTEAIIAAGSKRVVIGATDSNPNHHGRAFKILRRAGIEVASGVLADECAQLNEVFNHWIVHRMPFVTVKAAMTLDGKIGTAGGESKWITGEKARRHAMKLRQSADAILVGINTVLADNPRLTIRTNRATTKTLKRIILDSDARTPATAHVVSDEHAKLTTIVVSQNAPKRRVAELEKRVTVWQAPLRRGKLDLRWLLRKLGREQVTHLLVEGGGEANASFLFSGLAHRIAFFYAPKILGGRNARKAVAGDGARTLKEALALEQIELRSLGADLLLTARVRASRRTRPRLS